MEQKNLDKLVREALAIEEEGAREAGALGYYARILVQATMPHSRISEPFFNLTRKLDQLGQPRGVQARAVYTDLGIKNIHMLYV